MRGWQRIYRAMRQDHLHSFDHIAYDPDATSATPGLDSIGRRMLTIGPHLATALIASGEGTSDLWRDLDRLFMYREDADRAAPDVVRLARLWGATVETV